MKAGVMLVFVSTFAPVLALFYIAIGGLVRKPVKS
jgi:hypothetical protein